MPLCKNDNTPKNGHNYSLKIHAISMWNCNSNITNHQIITLSNLIVILLQRKTAMKGFSFKSQVLFTSCKNKSKWKPRFIQKSSKIYKKLKIYIFFG